MGALRTTHPALRTPHSALRTTLFFLALSVLHTWPLASAPHRLSLNHNADAQLNAWIVSWIAHVLPTTPAQFWQGNIFQPGEQALTFSEPLVIPAIAGAPVFWLSGSAVLTFNVLLILGLAATAWTGWWVVSRWTSSNGAGLVAGTLLTFNAHLLTRLPHLQAAHAWGLVLVWGAAYALLTSRGRWWWLSLAVAATAATSLHWLVFAVIGTGLMAVTVWTGWRSLARVAAAGAAGIAIALPVLWPHIVNTLRRPLEQVADFSATPAGYLASLSHLHRGWSAPFFTVDTNVFFPGVLALAAAAFGLVTHWKQPLVRWALALVVVGFVLSLGTATPVYEWAYRAFPPMQGIRAAARFGMLALAGIAVLAAFAVRRAPWWAAALMLAGVTVEQLHVPIRTTPFTGVPAVYSLLRDEPGPVLLAEMPFYPPDAVFENGEYVLNATAHWAPVMNGYSGVTPMSYRSVADTLWYFPQARAFPTLARSGATHVMVHLKRFGAEAPDVARALDGRADLRLMAADRDGHRLYRLVRE